MTKLCPVSKGGRGRRQNAGDRYTIEEEDQESGEIVANTKRVRSILQPLTMPILAPPPPPPLVAPAGGTLVPPIADLQTLLK